MANELVVLRDDIAESGFVVAEVFLSPLPGTEPMRVRARIGSLVRDILPESARAPMVCIIDGVPMKREWWMQRPVCEGDKIQFAPVYLGGGNSRSILGAIAAMALAYFVPGMVAGWGGIFSTTGTVAGMTWVGNLVSAGIILIGNALISAIITPNNSNNDGDKASSVYNVDVQGNASRVFNPIPVQYGRMKYYPNYAAQPYVEYHTTPPDITQEGNFKDVVPSEPGDHSDGTQYFYCLFCLGQGEYDIESIMIGDANIASFKDVLRARVLPPGERPSVVHACVVNSEVVSSMSMDKGEFLGGFPCCGPTRKTSHIALDFIFPQGLCKLNDEGKAKTASVSVVVQLRQLNDAGKAMGGWKTVFQNSFSAATLTPQRRTIHIRNIESARWECRVQRIGARNEDDQKDMTSLMWGALRAFLDEDAPLCKTATHFELVLRASEQLSNLSQRKISIISTRKVSSWDSDELTPTRSPARALWDKWTNSVYGDGLPRDRIDVEALIHLDELSSSRKDRFDFVFENRTSSQEADQTIAKVMRCVALQRQGVKTLVRDELCEMPLTMFNPTNTVENSMSLDYVQITEETTDGVIVEYFSGRSWDWEEVECPGPGRTYSNTSHDRYDPSLPVMENPARITLNGVTSRAHAEREGLYYAYTNALRRQFANWTTELQGALVYYGAPVLLASTLYNMQQGGEVRDYDKETGIMQLTNGVLDGKIVLMRKDGSLTEPLSYEVVDVETSSIRLLDEPGFEINYGDAYSERTKYIILEGELIRRIVKIMAISPRGIGDTGAPLYELKGVVDVPEVHLIDQTVPPDDDDPEGYDGPDDDVGAVALVNYRVIAGYEYVYTTNTSSVSYHPQGTTSYVAGGYGAQQVTHTENIDFDPCKWVDNLEAARQAGSKFEMAVCGLEAIDFKTAALYGTPKPTPIPSIVSAKWTKHEASEGYEQLDDATAEIVRQVLSGTASFYATSNPRPGVPLPNVCYYSEWLPMDYGTIVSFTASMPQGGMWGAGGNWGQTATITRSVVVAIRDKKTHSLQGTSVITLGKIFNMGEPPWAP